MMEIKIYKCECGKEFINPQSFNGHKSHCVMHLAANNKLYVKEKIAMGLLQGHIKGPKTKAIKKQAQLSNWISEKHTCEKCGKIMTEKFGSGRFCCRACANSRNHSEETKQKITKSVNNAYTKIIADNTTKYYNSPCRCAVCNKIISYKNRYNKTCSKDCYLALDSINSKKRGFGGLTRSSGGRSKHGWYKGYWCDSLWELCWVIYNLDHNIMFKRCPSTLYYEYNYNDEIHKYYPDFIMEDGSLVEIKNYYSPQVQAKIDAVKDRQITVLYEEDLEYAFEYVKANYSYQDLAELYDNK